MVRYASSSDDKPSLLDKLTEIGNLQSLRLLANALTYAVITIILNFDNCSAAYGSEKCKPL
jgi:hypothetical protein